MTYGLVRKRIAFFVGVLLFITILLTSFTLWLATGPRSITFVSNKIEKLLDSISSDYDFSVGNTFLMLKAGEVGLVFEVHDLKVRENSSKEIIASVPEIEVKLNMRSLLVGDLIIDEIFITKSNINIALYENIFSDSNYEKKERAVQFKKLLSEIISYLKKTEKIPIKKVNIKKTNINYYVGENIRKVKLPYISFDISKDNSKLSFKAESRIFYNKKDIFFKITGGLEELSNLYVVTYFYNLETEHIVDFIPELSWLKQVKQDMNGMIRLNVNKSGTFKNILFSFQTLETQKEDISVNGKINFAEDTEKNISEFSDIVLSTEITNFEVDKLYQYWGEQFVPKVRSWVVNNIKGGIIPHASLKLNISAHDILKGKIGGDSLYANVTINNTSLQIPKSNFKIGNINGNIIFTSDKMDFTLANGRFLSSDLKKGSVIISNMNDENKIAINIKGLLLGGVNNLIKISELYKDDSAVVENDNRKISGDAITNFSISFPLGNNFSTDKIIVDGRSSVKNFTLEDRNFKINSGDFVATFKNNKLTVHGYGYLNDLYSHIDFDGTNDVNNFSVNFAADKDDIDKMQFAFLPISDGIIKVSLSGKMKGKLEELKGKIDFSNAIIDIPYLNYKSKINEKSVLEFSFSDKNDDDDDDNLEISHNSDGMQFSAKGKIDISTFAVENLNISNFKIKDNTDIKVKINKNTDNIYDIKISGESLDLSNIFNAFSNQNKENINLSFNLGLSLGRIIAQNEIELNDVNFQLSCSNSYCDNFRLRSSILGDDTKNVVLDYMPTTSQSNSENNDSDNTIRVFSLKTNNAGLFFKAIGINDKVVDGKIELTAITRGNNFNLRDGKVIMKKFKVVKAVLLGKLLNVLSIDIFDLLQGAGIGFKKMSGKFSYIDKVLTISGLNAKGTSLGITADGTVDMKNNKYDLDGAIVPAYFINSLLGRIPLLGSIFVGKEGEGIIASRYTVRGDYDNPTIGVNPLSMLTPGFLRNIWGGKSEKEMDEKMQE